MPQGEGFENTARGFSDKEVRRAFIRKVYTLLALEIFILTAFVTVGAFLEPLRLFAFFHPWIHLGLMIGFMVAGLIPLFVLLCSQRLRVRVPINFILLNMFVVSMSVGAMLVTALYEAWIFLAAFGITLALVIFITMLTFSSCIDFTGSLIFIVVLIFITSIVGSSSLLLYFMLGMRIMTLVYAAVSIIICSLYLVFVTQLIIGGKSAELEPDEYVLGVVLLFTQFFIMLLSFMRLLKG